jgi:hypothetical protein
LQNIEYYKLILCWNIEYYIMPYLNYRIEKHNEACKAPIVKRLYVRDYDKNGKQRYISYGVTCLNCDVLVTERFHHNPTAKEISKKGEYSPEQEKQFKIIEQKYWIDVTSNNMGGLRKKAYASFNEWVRKLVEAGMNANHAYYRISRSLSGGKPIDIVDRKHKNKRHREVMDQTLGRQ